MIGTLAIAASLSAQPLNQDATASTAPADPVQRLHSLPNRSPKVVEVQVLLDRVRHSPGVIDGIMGDNTRRAIRAYRAANGLSQSDEIDDQLVSRLRRGGRDDPYRTYTVTSDDADGPFRSVPSTMTGKADLDRVAFEDTAELLAEKFHMSRSFLEALNPGADFGQAGTNITVVRAGTDEQLPQVQRIDVDKQANELRAYSESGSLVATYPTTVGSNIHPSPNETLQVLAVAPDPTYHFDPSGRTWGPDEELTIAPGPNNPVGTVWIDLSRDGYGIHGTPEPKLIGKTSSHGCVRLTNWDAIELSRAVAKGTTVHFR
jgi:lipoprotein-anchoring transpeptidase ErfK/SrfK